MAGFNWKAFLEEILGIVPQVIADTATDKASFGSESHVQAATTAALQASQIAQTIDPNDTNTIQAATALTTGVIQGVFTPTPAAPTT